MGNFRFSGTSAEKIKEIAREEERSPAEVGRVYAEGDKIIVLDSDNLKKDFICKADGTTITDVNDLAEIKSKFDNMDDDTGNADYQLSKGLEKVGLDILKSDGSIEIQLTGGEVYYYDALDKERKKLNYIISNPVTAKKYAWDGTDLGDQDTWDFTSVDNGTNTPDTETNNMNYTAPWLFFRENVGVLEFAQLISQDNYSNENQAQRQETSTPNEFPTFLNGWKLLGKMLARTSEDNLNRDRVYRMNSLRGENKLVAVGTTSEDLEFYKPLPTTSVTLDLGFSYYGRNNNTYTIPDPLTNDPKWFEIISTENAKGTARILVTSVSPFRLPNSDTEIVGEFPIDPRTKIIAFWDEIDSVWELEVSTDAFVDFNALDDGKTLLRGAAHSIYNGGTNPLTFKIPSPVGEMIEFYYDSLSVGDIILEQVDLAETPQQLFLNGVNNTQTISVDNKGSWVRLLGNTTTGFWNIQIVRPYDPQDNTKILQNITFSQVRSAGTNASSSWSFQIFDEDGNQYPASDWAITATFTQYTGGTEVINLDKAITNGTINIGRNKNAPFVIAEYIGQNPNGVSNIITSGANGTSVTGTTQTLNYEGTNYSDTFNGTPIAWTTNNQVQATDQGAPWLPDTAYPVGAIISHNEEDPADANNGKLFNWRVITSISETDHSIWDSTDFSIQTKLERFAIGVSSSFDNASPYTAGEDYTSGSVVLYTGTQAEQGLWQASSDVTNADANIENEAFFFRGKLPTQDRSRVVPDGTNISLDVFDMETNQTSLRFIIREGESATFTKNSNPAIVEVLGDDSVVTLTDTGTTSRSVLINAPVNSDVEFEFQRNSTQFNFIVKKLVGNSGGDLVTTYIDSNTGVITETLPASTALGVVKLFTNEDVTNTATLSVQTGETLNGVIDGTFLFSNYAAGTQFRADEVGVGWVVSVVGTTSTTNGYNLITTASTDIVGISGTTFIYDNTNPASGQVAINGSSYYDEGAYRYVKVDLIISTDPDCIYEIGSNIMPVGGEIVSAHISGQALGQTGRYAMVGVVSGQTNQFFTNRLDSIDNVDMAISVWLKVSNPTGEGALVLAGMVATEDTEVELYSGTHTSIDTGIALTGAASWNDVYATYNKIKVYIRADALGRVSSGDFLSSQVALESQMHLYSNGTNFANIERDENTANTFSVNNSNGDGSFDIVIIGVKKRKTITKVNESDFIITNPNEAGTDKVLQPNGDGTGTFKTVTSGDINDQSSSGYVDIGNTRIQWGTSTAGGAGIITFPVAFLNSSYKITSTVITAGGDGTNNASFNSKIYNKTTTGALVRITLNTAGVDAGSGWSADWIAIGLKP